MFPVIAVHVNILEHTMYHSKDGIHNDYATTVLKVRPSPLNLFPFSQPWLLSFCPEREMKTKLTLYMIIIDWTSGWINKWREKMIFSAFITVCPVWNTIFFRATVMEESSIARRVVRALDLQHNTPFPVFFSFLAASRLSRVEWFSRAFASRSLYYTWGKMRDYS